MSCSVHRRMVADATMALEHRASHARSCALHVAIRLAVKRGAVLERVTTQQTGVDLDMPGSDEELAIAFASIDDLRSGETQVGSGGRLSDCLSTTNSMF